MSEKIISITEEIQARDGVAVVVYTKHDCRWCDMTKMVLDREGIHYTAVNVEEDATAYAYVTETLNRREMPVVVAAAMSGDVVWSGFQPVMIREHITHRQDVAA